MNLMPHNHLMWASIGIYTGREDNILWRKKEGSLEAHDVRCLFAGDVATLSQDAIHSVTNPLERFTGGLHIYGGDFFATERSQWNPETLDEEPSNGVDIRGIFERANERMRRLESERQARLGLLGQVDLSHSASVEFVGDSGVGQCLRDHDFTGLHDSSRSS